MIYGVSNIQGKDNSSQAKQTNLDKDAFLQLLVTQLRNQDPLKPMEDKEFIAQLAQFSSLEQMQNLNKQVAQYFTQFQEWQATDLYQNLLKHGMDLIGKQVTVATGDGEVTGTVTGIKTSDHRLKLVVAGNEYDMEQVVAVTLGNPGLVIEETTNE